MTNYFEMITEADELINDAKHEDKDEDLYPLYLVLRAIYKLIKIIVLKYIETK